MNKKNNNAFTVVELLVTIGIIAILSAVSIVIVNPAESLEEWRDLRRVSDVDHLGIIISEETFENQRVSLGNANTLYISIPDSTSTCANLDLPDLPSGWSYLCVTEDNLKNTDGTGWIPINLEDSKLGVLPIDPQNATSSWGSYYFYATDGTDGFVVGAQNLESEKSGIGGDYDKVSTDGGVNNYAYEQGTDLSFYGQTNVLINSNVDDLAGGYFPGWNTNLNGESRSNSGFGPGYNDNVENPGVGYHAHATKTRGIQNTPMFEFIDENCQYGYCNRWLGISQEIANPGTNFGWTDGTRINVRYMLKTNNTEKPARTGLYHYSVGAEDTIFGDAIEYRYTSKADEWQLVSHSFVVDSDWEVDSNWVRLYLYGHYAQEGQVFIDNIQLEYINP